MLTEPSKFTGEMPNGKIVIVRHAESEYSLDDLLKGVTKRNVHSEVKTGPAVGREAW